MKIFSEVRQQELYAFPGKTIPIFFLYLDSQLTGDPSKDIFSTAIDMVVFGDWSNSDRISSIILSLMQELIYSAFGSPLETKPMTDWKETKFDRNFPNGVKV